MCTCYRAAYGPTCVEQNWLIRHHDMCTPNTPHCRVDACLTKLAHGSSGIPECLFVNRRVEEFGDGFAWVDLDVGEI